jgi:hypothetical protein
MGPGQQLTNKLHKMFESLELEPYKKLVLQERYLDVLYDFKRRASRLSCMFYSSRLIVTIGSILVPAFLSIQGSGATLHHAEIYWTTWIISVMVTICNGLVSLFKLDKKYFFIHTTLELLTSEGWQYIGLSGRYSPKDAPVPPTHENQFLIFFHMAEKIKMRQVEEEYWKFTDTAGIGNATNQKPMDVLQTPSTKQAALALLPTDKKEVLEAWLDDIKVAKPMMDGILPRNTIDGDIRSPTVFKTSNQVGMPVQLFVPEVTITKIPVLPDSPNSIRGEA